MNVERELQDVVQTLNVSTPKAVMSALVRVAFREMKLMDACKCQECVPMVQFVIEMLFVNMRAEIDLGTEKCRRQLF
jgi:hypothetical protein